MKYFIIASSVLLSLLSCSTGSKHLLVIDKASTEIQAGRPEQGREALEHECASGSYLACALLGKAVPLKDPRPILQSVTTTNQSRFVITVPHHVNVHYFVRSPQTFEALRAEHFERDNSTSAVDQVEAFNLDPKVNYELIVAGPDGSVWDRRGFQSLDLNRRRARIAVASGMDDALKSVESRMWAQLAGMHPDVLFLIGQNVYPEKEQKSPGAATPDLLWRRYLETWSNLGIFKVNPLIPVFATWDDLDFGKIDGDRTYPFKFESMDIFLTFFAQRKSAPHFERGPGVASWWSAFGVNFAFLDNRTFRSPDGLDVTDQTHFGDDQDKWIREEVGQATGPVILISGDSFFATHYPFESYANNHPRRLKEQLEAWRRFSSPLIFLSGHRHLSEIVKIPPERLGYPTYEIVTGGMHARLAPDAFSTYPNPDQVVGKAGEYNYLILELIRGERNFVQFDVQAFGLDQKQLYQKTLTVKH